MYDIYMLGMKFMSHNLWMIIMNENYYSPPEVIFDQASLPILLSVNNQILWYSGRL